jgi:hypothetical protein
MRYADAVSIDEHGNTIADLRRISLIEQDTGTDFAPAAAEAPPAPAGMTERV